MAVSNAKIADLLRRYARTLELARADRFKIKAYRRAAVTIETLSEDVPALVLNNGDLTQIPNVGKAISEIIHEIVSTGTIARLDSATAELSPDLAELATHPALDPRKVKQVYKKLGINCIAELKERTRSVRYTHPENAQDDALHAANYALIVATRLFHQLGDQAMD